MRRLLLRLPAPLLRPLRWYGAGPLHLLALLGSFALAGYAAMRFVPGNPLGVAAWFVGAIVGHDLILVPLYSLLDLGARTVLRHRPAPDTREPPGPWLNHLRVPVILSALLFVVFAPLILRLPPSFEKITGRPVTPYLPRWLLITGALFVVSALILAWRMSRARRITSSSTPDAGPPGR